MEQLENGYKVPRGDLKAFPSRPKVHAELQVFSSRHKSRSSEIQIQVGKLEVNNLEFMHPVHVAAPHGYMNFMHICIYDCRGG